MSRLQKDSTIPSVASTSQEDQESRTLKVTLLSSEWRSSTDGDLSTINRELAIQLAKHPSVDVSVLLPNCSREDRSSAKGHNVKLIEAGGVPGLEPVLCLSSPPINHTMDCVIGHGVHLGQPIALIKRNPIYSCCKWIQVVHSAPEEDGMYKIISEGEKMQKTEIQLCKMADQVITIGPKLAEAYRRHLYPVKQQENIFDLTPSIFSEFLEVEQATEERRTFCILVIGSGDSCEDFKVKGYDIAAKAIAELKDESYKLKFVCTAGGKGDIVAEKLLHHGIKRNQLIVRSLDDNREVLANLFCEVDLAIMPSRTEGFGITALEALSAGLPVLVSGNSGLGEALKKVPLGSQSVVDSEDPKDWAKEIKRVRDKEREVRLSESRFLREKYLEKYSWEEPCKSLVIKMKNLVFGGNEQVIRNLQQWQQDAGRCKISSNTDQISNLKKIASEKGYRISDNQGSGNCMFYALSEQLEIVKGVKIHHFELRRSLVQYLREHPKQVDGTDLFHFVDKHTTWNGYLTDMEQDSTWGDHVVLWAAANCYQIAIHVISSLPGHSEVIIKPDFPFDQSKHLVLGHVHEVHYFSLQPLQGRDKRPAPVSADKPRKRLREELTNHDCCEGQNRHLSSPEHDQYKVAGGSSTCYRGLVQQRSHPQGSSSYGLPAPVAVDYSQGNLGVPLINPNFKGQNRHLSTEHDQNSFAGASSTYYRGLVHQRGHPHGQNRYPSTEHDQYKVAGGSSTCYRGIVQQTSHPQGSSSYGLPAPVAVDYSQGNLGVPLINPHFKGQNRHLSTEHDQNSFAGASSTYYRGRVHQRGHPHGSLSFDSPAPVAVDYSQGNLRAPFVNLNFEGQNRHPSSEHDQNSFAGTSSTYYRGLVHQRGHPHGQNRHPSTEHDQNSFAGASSTYCRGLVYQRSHPHGSLSSDSPAPVAVDYSQGNLPAAFVNSNYQGSQTFPQSSLGYGLPHLLPGHSQSPSASDIARNEDPIQWGSHTQSSFSHGLSPPFVQQNQYSTPATTSIQLELTYQRGNFRAVVYPLLKKGYKRRSQLKPLFWDNTIQLPLEEVYTRLKILHRRKQDFQLENTEVNMSEIFKNGDDIIVLVEGSPGMGKTTFCLKIAHDWANKATSKDDTFPQFEVVLLLKCRDIHGDIIEAIDTQLLPESKTNIKAFKDFFDYIEDFHYQKKVLIILDGLDELPKMSENCVDKLLQKNILPYCYVLATSRQEKGIVVRKKVNFDMLLQIEGFTREDAFNYVRKHFKNRGPENVSNGERLITEIQTNTFLDALWNNPLNLSLLCIVFEDHKGELPSHRTELYQIIVCCILQRYCGRHNLETPAGDKALLRHFEDSLVVLGELAWRCLKEGRFSFREEELGEFESRHESLAARKLGLVFKEASLRKINPQHEYFFFHKTFQEYLAAFYLAHMLLKQMVDFSVLNFDEDLVERYRQVFVFMSGILGGEAGLLFEQIGKKLKDENWDWCKCYKERATFFQECFHESRNYEQVAMVLCSFIPFPQTVTIDLSDEELTTEWLIILNACTSSSQLQLPVHLAIRSIFDDVQADVNNDLLADFVAFNTRLQTLSFSVMYMTEEITTLLCRVLRVDSTAYSFTLEVTCSNIFSVEVVAISDSLAANKTLKTVTFQLPCRILEDYVAILDKGLSADTSLTSIVLKTFGPWTETEAELFRKILLNRSLTSQSLAVGGKMQDSLATSVSEGLVANSSLKSLALIFCGKLSHSGLSLLKEGFLGNRSLESLQLKVFGELPTNLANICGTLQSAIKSTTSFTVYPNVTGMVGNSQVAFLCPVLKENISASKLHSVTVNIWGELDCSGATDLCKLLIASSASCVNLIVNGRITDSVADCLFRHFNKLNTLSNLSIDIRGEVMGNGKNTLQRLSSDQIYFFAFNVHSFNSGNKICREVCLSTDDSSAITPVFAKVKDGCVTKLNVSINNPGSISEDWKCNLFEGLAKNECVTTLNLVFGDIYLLENIDGLVDGLGKNTSLTTLSLSFDNYDGIGELWTLDLGDGLGENTSLTTLSLTFNNYSEIEDVGILHLAYGLGENTSLTTLSLTFNNYHKIEGVWMLNPSDGLGKNTSLTMLSLTVNNYCEITGKWECFLADDLVENTSLTMLSIKVNNYGKMRGEWTCGLDYELEESTSLTTLSLAVNNYGEMRGNLTYGLANWLGKNTSLTTLSVVVNNYSEIEEVWTRVLANGLGENTSLTTLSLAVNNYSEIEEVWTSVLADGLAKNTSVVTLNLTLSNWNNLYEDWIHVLVDALATNMSSTAISLEVNIFGEGNEKCESILA